MRKINVLLLTFISIYLIIISINLSTSFKCGTDDLKIEPITINTSNESKKRKTANEYTPIKIKADYTSFTKKSSMSDQTLQKAKQLIDETIGEFPKFLKVQHTNFELDGEENNIKKACLVKKISSDYENFLIDNDLIIFPSFDGNLTSNVLAAATFCLVSSEDQRPVAGVLYINPNLSFDRKNTDIYMKRILLHEITHILIFHPVLFSRLGLIKKINDVYYITSPKVLNKARQHFNCASLTGIQLENQGSEGSAGAHWEARYMLGDTMISTNYIEEVMSDITLAIFEDSGFYKVNYYSGGLFKFGKNKGCEFFNRKCIYNGDTDFDDEFCLNFNGDSCANTRTNKGKCLIYNYNSKIPEEYRYFTDPRYGGFYPTDYCPIINVDSNSLTKDYCPTSCKYGDSSLLNYGEIIGEKSFCFNSSLLPSSSRLNPEYNAICYEVECDNINKQIIIKYGSSTIKCPTTGGTLSPSNFKGTVICPKYYDICSASNGAICNDMFDCFDKKVTTDQNSYLYVPGQTDDEPFNEPVEINDDDDDDRIPIYRNNNSYSKYNYNIFTVSVLILLTFL